MTLLSEAVRRASDGETVFFVVHTAAIFGHLRHLLSVAEWADVDLVCRHDRVLVPGGGEVRLVVGDEERLRGIPQEQQVWDHYARGWA